VLLFVKDNGVVVISIVATLLLLGLLVYFLVNRRNNARRVREAIEVKDDDEGYED
jgi:hypothetical protein